MSVQTATSSRVGGRLGERKGNVKSLTQNLDPVHPERYSRPDFTRWAVFKSDPSTKPETASVPNPNEEKLLAKKSASTISPRASISARGGSTEPGGSVTSGRSSSAPPAAPSVPQAVAAFIGKLPPASEYVGPIIPVDDMLKIIMGLPVQVPAGEIKWVPADEYVVVSTRSRREDSHHRRGDDRRDRDHRDRPYDRRSSDRDRERERDRDRDRRRRRR